MQVQRVAVSARGLLLGLALGLGIGVPVEAQAGQSQTAMLPRKSTFVSLSALREGKQPMPVALERRVSFTFDSIPLAQALRTIAKEAGLGISYRDDGRGPQTPISARVENVTAADAFDEVLRGTTYGLLVSETGLLVLVNNRDESARRRGAPTSGTVSGRVTDAKTQAALAGATVVVQGTAHSATTGNDGRYRIAGVAPGTYTVQARYIGYAPGSASVTVNADQEATADFTLEKSAQRLDEVVTTGTVVPTEVKVLPTPISVITSEDLQLQSVQRLDQVFRGQVPGAIAWDVGATSDQNIVSVRGISTLTQDPSIKTFVDGVEVANPSYISTIDPNSVDRIEITRGPQASTLYGAGALDGVMQIFTKKGRLGLTRPEVSAKVSAGGVGGFDGQSTAAQTDDAVSLLGGSEKASYNLGGSYRHVGGWLPSYSSSNWAVSAGGQTTQGPLTLASSLRYADQTRNSPWDTRFQAYPDFSTPPYQTNRVRQQTYGVTASLQATRDWSHSVTLGYDQTYYGYQQTQPRLTTPDDSFLVSLGTHSAKTSLLYHTDLRVRLGRAVATTVTAGVNYDAYDFLAGFSLGATRTSGTLDGFAAVIRTPWTSTGYFGQLQLSLADHLFLTGGIRAERNANFGAGIGTAWSPRVGASYVAQLGPTHVKMRASYGEGIRAPLPTERDGSVGPFSIQQANPALGPERQRGVDGGVDLYLGAASVGVTYYRQRVLGLIDAVTLPTPAGTVQTYRFQNVSRVKNEGWEFEAHLPLGPVRLTGTYSITHSTVQELPPGFPAGTYEVGDQLVNVPRAAAGAMVTYSPLPRTTLTASMTHIGHWTNLDFFSYYADVLGGQHPYRGSQRAYWIEYPTVTKFAVGVNQMLTKRLTAFAHVDNVGNNLRSEQDVTQIPTPRSVLVGANVRY